MKKNEIMSFAGKWMELKIIMLSKISQTHLVLMAHVYNPSYSEGRDQEDCGLKPAKVKYFSRPYL
jgi:hypothetical protein